MSPRSKRGTIARVLISMTKEELAEIDEAAKRASLDRSSFIRSTVLKAVRSTKP